MVATGEIEANVAKEAARDAAERLLGALNLGAWDDVAEAAEAAYLTIGRLAALARAAHPNN